MFSPRHNRSAHLHPSEARRVAFFERPKKVTEEIRPAAAITSAILAATGEPSVARSGLLVSDGFGCGKADAPSELRLTVSIFFGGEGTGCAETHNTEGAALQTLCRAEHRRHLRLGPQGARQDGVHSFVGIRDVPSKEPRNCREAQGSSRQWAALLWGESGPFIQWMNATGRTASREARLAGAPWTVCGTESLGQTGEPTLRGRSNESTSGPLDDLDPCTSPNRGHEKVLTVRLLGLAPRRWSGNTRNPKLELGGEKTTVTNG